MEQLIQETLAKCAEEGFDPQRIESIIHQIELSQKNVSAGAERAEERGERERKGKSERPLK